MGSTIALTDGLGVVQTDYTYEPFGGVSVAGTSNGNTFAFTGREADGTGLYFYRARYYSSELQRFLAVDPIDFSCGDPNLYAYVGNRPTNVGDPEGLCPVCPVVVVAGGRTAAEAAALAAAAAATAALAEMAKQAGAYMGRAARCWKQYKADRKECGKLSSAQERAICYSQAMERYVACKNGKWVPPLIWPE